MVYDNDKMKEYNKEYKEKYRSKPENRTKEVEYREKNKAHRGEQIHCDNCGGMISRSSMSTHKKSMKCMKHNE